MFKTQGCAAAEQNLGGEVLQSKTLEQRLEANIGKPLMPKITSKVELEVCNT